MAETTLTDADKADIIKEVLAEIYANSQQTSTLEKVGNLDGITSLPAVKDDSDIVAVPLSLLTTSQPIEISSEEDIAILAAQGKLVDSQIYYLPEEED